MHNETAVISEQDTLQGTVHEIESLFAGIVTSLVKRRDDRYAAETAPLDTERESLAQESATIDQTRRELAAVLPARIREAERQADNLLIAGKTAEAESTLAAAKASGPEGLNERQREISARIKVIDSSKQRIAKTLFEAWCLDLQVVSRAIERGHFITFLDGLQTSFGEFEKLTNIGLVREWHLIGLTAPERTQEWERAQKWYRGRA